MDDQRAVGAQLPRGYTFASESVEVVEVEHGATEDVLHASGAGVDDDLRAGVQGLEATRGRLDAERTLEIAAREDRHHARYSANPGRARAHFVRVVQAGRGLRKR